MWLDLLEIGAGVIGYGYLIRRLDRISHHSSQSVVSHPKEEAEVEDYLDPYRTNAKDPKIEPPIELHNYNDIFKFARLDPTGDVPDRYECPKCSWYVRADSMRYTKSHPKICQCAQHTKLHYHYQCGTCKYRGIMKTKDDK